MRRKSGLLDVVHTLWANILILGLNIGTGILTARFLGAEGRGEMAAMIYWPQLMAYVLTLGLPSAITYHLKHNPSDANRIVGSIFWVGAVLGTIAAVIGVNIIPFWLRQYSVEVIEFAQYAMAFSPLALIGLMLVAAAQSRPTLKIFNIARFSSPLITFFLLACLLMLSRLSPISAAISYFLGSAIVSSLLAIWACRKFRPLWSGSVQALRGLLSYGLRSYGVELLRVLSMYFDRMIVLFFLDATAMGLYVVALSLAQILNVIPNGISSVLFPRASGQSREAVLHMSGQAIRFGLIAAIAAGIPLILAGPYLLGLVYGDEFTHASSVLRLLIVYVMISGLALILEQAYMALGMPGRISLLQGLAFGSGVPLLIWLVRDYGIEGAGISLLGMAILRFVLVYTNIARSMGVPAPGLFPRVDEVKHVYNSVKRRFFNNIII